MRPRLVDLALSLAVLLEVVEILRRVDPLTLVIAAIFLLGAVFFLVENLFWVAPALAVLFLARVARRRIGGPLA